MKSVRYIILAIVFSLAACDVSGVPAPNDNLPDNRDGTDSVIDNRVSLGLQALYTFRQGSGTLINDVSGSGTPMALTIEEPDKVTWLPGGGIEITQPTLIATATPATKLATACMPGGEITVEAWVSPRNLNDNGQLNRIIHYGSSPGSLNFALGQQGTDAEARLRTTETGEDGSPGTESGITPFSVAGVTKHLTYTRNGIDDEGKLYVDAEVSNTSTVAGNMSEWSSEYRFALGNTTNKTRPWLGQIYLVAVYCRSLAQTDILKNYKARF